MKGMLSNYGNDNYDNGVIIAVSNSYEQLYYYNEDFDAVPKEVQEDIKVLMVLHTEEVGGIVVLGFDVEGTLFLEAAAGDFDAYYDEIGSHLKIKKILREKKELFEALENFYNCFF